MDTPLASLPSQPANKARQPAGFSSLRFYPVLILLLGILVYSNTLDAPFVFDDHYYITENSAVKDFRYFLSPSLVEQGMAKGELDQNFRTRRVAVFSFAVNYWLHGLRVEGYHAFNLFLHLSNGLLVFWLVNLTLRTPIFAKGKSNGLPRGQINRAALLVALFFVAHPVQTEAVTYVCQRFTAMATTFYLLALDLFIVWRRSSVADGREQAHVDRSLRPVWYGLSLLATLLAMFTKEIAFTLPLMLVLYDGMFFGWSLGRRPWPFLPFLASLLIIPATIFGGGASYADVARLSMSLSGSWVGNPALTYLFTQSRVVVTYLRLLLLPVQQNIDYDYPRYAEFFQLPVAGSFLFLSLLGVTGVYLYRCSVRQSDGAGGWQRLSSFGICWFFLALAVESTIIPLKDLLFEHRLYLPSVGFFLAMLRGVELARARFSVVRTKWAVLLLVALLTALALTAYARNELWRDPVALWEDAVRKSPHKFRPHSNLGKEYVMRGRLTEAEGQLLQAVRIDGRRAMAHMNLGVLYLGMGKLENAIESFERAARLEPGNPEIYYNLGLAHAEKGDYGEATRALQKAQQLNPTDAETRRKLEVIVHMRVDAPAK